MQKMLRFTLSLCYLACALSSCSAGEHADTIRQSLIIQLPLHNKVITTLQENLKPRIESILHEELAEHTLDPQIPPFFFKKRQAITIYYLNDFYNKGRDLLFSALEELGKQPAPKNVSLTANLAFFGEESTHAQALIDLVMHIDDPKKELTKFNTEAKTIAHRTNEMHKKTHAADLYDITKSERFAYLAHLSLGHLRINYIKSFYPDQLAAQQIIERIKKRIIDIVQEELNALFASEGRTVSITNISVYDLKTRGYIKEVQLQTS